MNEKRKEILKKCEIIDKVKHDLNNIEKFDEIYSNFKVKSIVNNYPKIINDSEPSSIILNKVYNPSDVVNINNDKNLSFFINGKNYLDFCKISDKNNSKNIKEKISKSYIEKNIDLLTRKKIENELQKSIENKKEDEKINKKERQKKKIQDMIEALKQKRNTSNKSHKSNNNNYKNNNNKKKQKEKSKRNMKDINNYLFGINDEISLSSEKRVQSQNIFQRLYNHGFYLKNKSQINILSNIRQIKKDSKRKNISKRSKEILGLNNSKHIKYSKDNIFKPIKSNMKTTYFEFQFQPSINEKTKKLIKNMEKSFTRTTKSKSKTFIEPIKKSISKEKYQKSLDRINFLYLDGVEKIKKKKSCLNDENNDLLNNEKIGKNYDDSLTNIRNNNSRNIYYKQIQWKKRLMKQNELKKKNEETKNYLQCTFKPNINIKSTKYLFQKTEEKKARNKNSKDIYQNSINKSLTNKNNLVISDKRYFIINDENKFGNKRIRNKTNFMERHNDKKIEYSLNQRKTYNLENFFS